MLEASSSGQHLLNHRGEDAVVHRRKLYQTCVQTLKPCLRHGEPNPPLGVSPATASHADADDYVVSTGTGRKHNPSNLRRYVLAKAIEKANAELAKDGIAPSGKLGFHGLR